MIVTRTDKIHRKSLFLSLFALIFLFSNSLAAQNPSFTEKIRFPLWAMIDAYPGSFDEDFDNFEGFNDFGDSDNSDASDDFDNHDSKIAEDSDAFNDYESEEKDSNKLKGKTEESPVDNLKKIAPFLVNGMVYGWDFVYVPYDKTRGVEEYFEMNPIYSQELVNYGIKYSSPWVENGQLNCWIDYVRSDAEIQNYKMWSTIKNHTIQGRGYGPLEKGFDGIKIATEDALKNGVREYFRGILKDKPKEIRGSVLIRTEPILNVSSGRYVIILDFFLEYSKIKMYTQF
ncbi:MAG: hypothetical protein MJ188_02605 [Treponema sp.]|nr:hypothetical protein [Treponema sp.]